MNPFDRARLEARRVRALLAPSESGQPIASSQLLSAVEEVLDVGIQSVPATYAELGGGSAVLKRDERFIYVDDSVPPEKWAGLVAHELGHWFLDPEKRKSIVIELNSLSVGASSPGVVWVEAYGAREREELQANVFAREFLLPREAAKQLFQSGVGPREAARCLGLPLEFVRQQMLEACLLPDADNQSPTRRHTPSEDQKRAAEAEERFANVVAGPGTGKTSTLIHRVKHLIEVCGVDPSKILVLTFTNKAASDLVERLSASGVPRTADLWAGTFHAFGLEFFRKYHDRFGLEPDVLVADNLNCLTLLAGSLPNLSLGSYSRVQDPYEWLQPILEGVRRLKEELISPSEYKARVARLEQVSPELTARRMDLVTIYEEYERILRENKMVDFVDLIAVPAISIREDRAPYSAVADRFHHILVDEYQDVTQAMVELVRQLASKANSLWVVGDVRQAIHHWRGASVRSLIKFEETFRGQAGSSRIQKYPLERNRRSTQEILHLAQDAGRNHILERDLPLDEMVAEKGSSGAHPRIFSCEDRRSVLTTLTNHVKGLRESGIGLSDQAVLCRWASDVEEVAEYLRSNGVPSLFLGAPILRSEVKVILCLMQLVTERLPSALVGLSSIPKLAMPIQDIELLLNSAKSERRWQRGRWLTDPPDGLSEIGLAALEAIHELVGTANYSTSPWVFICEVLLEKRLKFSDIEDDSVEASISRIALWQFANSARIGNGERKFLSLTRFLNRLQLRFNISDGLVERGLPAEASNLDAVRVLTIHGSKGLEFDAVHIPFVNSSDFGPDMPSWSSSRDVFDLVPPDVLGSSQREYERECCVERNNLLYVAISRAKSQLFAYWNTEYSNALAPQLQDAFEQFGEVGIRATPNMETPVPHSGGPVDPPIHVSFEQLETYERCPLQYWYRYVLRLPSERDLETFARARLAIQEALRDFAGNPISESVEHLKNAWERNLLPEREVNEGLWTDALDIFDRGVAVSTEALRRGGSTLELRADLLGLSISLPWGIAEGTARETTISFLRLSGSERFRKLIRPLMKSAIESKVCRATVNCFLPLPSTIEVTPSARVENTNAVKAARGLLSRRFHPKKGRQCKRCPYLTICPSAPGATLGAD